MCDYSITQNYVDLFVVFSTSTTLELFISIREEIENGDCCLIEILDVDDDE